MAVKTHLNDLIDRGAVTRAIENNMWAYLSSWFRSDSLQNRISRHESSDVSWALSHEPAVVFNPVWGADFHSSYFNERVEAIVTLCKQRQTPFSWAFGPSSAPVDAGRILMSYGLKKAPSDPGLALDLSTLPDEHEVPAGVTISRVTDDFALMRLSETITRGFGIPERYGETVWNMWQHSLLPAFDHIRHYVAYLDGEVVATSTAILDGSVVGLYNVTTLPYARHKGIGTAMTIQPLLEARADGYKVGILNATPAGRRMYEQIGFRHFGDITAYYWSPSAYVN